ncbi:MAG: ABC transporter permease [Nitriliruptoraceae bacterium]
MTWSETLRVAIRAMVANRLRSMLTVLGVLIGVMSVVLLVAIGQGAREEITGTIEGLGSNLLFVLPGDGDFGSAAPTRSRFVADDVDRLDRALDGGVAGSVLGGESLQAEGRRLTTTVNGVTGQYFEVVVRSIARGQRFSESDFVTARRVLLLGATAAEALFGELDPIGRNVTIGGTRFRVAGVMERVGGAAFGPDRDREVYVPLAAAQRLFATDRLDAIFVRSATTASVEADRATVMRVLSQRLDSEEFSVLSQDEIIGVVGDILQILTWVLGAIAGISLLVGGVGVSNIMLVSVTERTREIGLRMALGAKPRDITRQFLVEAVVLTGVGGVVGLLLGIGLAAIVTIVSPLPSSVTAWSIILAFSVSVAVGLVFGVLPARRAGRLDPVVALRHD